MFTCLSRYPLFITFPLISTADSDVSDFTLPLFFKLSACKQSVNTNMLWVNYCTAGSINGFKIKNLCAMLSVRRWRSVHQDFLVLTKLYSAVESSMNCSPRPAVRRASTLLRPTVRRQPSSSRAEASVTASTRVRVSCMNTSQSTTAEPAGTSHLYMTCLCFTMNFKQLVPL